MHHLQALVCSLHLAAALGLLAGCGAAPPGRPGRADVADDLYLLRVADMGQMGRLRDELSRRGLRVRHEYSEAVGLRGALSVQGAAAMMRDLLAQAPDGLLMETQASALRYLMQAAPGCGDGTCAADEAATLLRTTTCSYDCGTPPPRESQDELSNSWHVSTVGADRVWPTTRGEGIHIAVLDTGYDRGLASTHPDRPESLGAGYDFAAGQADFAETDSHGTHVAGIIAAPRNGYGMVGVAPGATVHAYQVFHRRGGGVSAADADIIAAIEAAIRNNIHIINMSLGGPTDSPLEHEALRKAYDAGILAVVAAGNAEDYDAKAVQTAPRHYPGAYPESMSVGATTRSETIAGFSSTGSTVTVSAPGAGVYSTVPVGQGDSYTRAVFDIQGVRMAQLQAVIPAGASLTTVSSLPLVSCGYGRPEDVWTDNTSPATACRTQGKAALVQRGPAGEGQMPVTFADKIRNARMGGAAAVLIYNHRAGDAALAGGQFGADIGVPVPVPVLTLPAGDGEQLVRLLQQGKEVRLSAATTKGDHASYSGTSMAAPVVSGVAALVWSRSRHLSNVQLRQLLSESAVDLGGAGRDDAFGWGRVDAARALGQGTPFARCGDGMVDRASEICDGSMVGGKTCEDYGWDEVAGRRLVCNSRCTAPDTGACECLGKGERFEAAAMVSENMAQGGKRGTLAIYLVKLQGQPVRGALAKVTVRYGGAVSYRYELGPSDSRGMIEDFTPYEGTGMTAGAYEFSVVLSKGGGRCHPDQPTSPPSYTVTIKN